ncbi:MAG: MFS transporter [Candidatus Dormibacteraeota bacterium]|nr:MFS transporter [Candidatus Dormibacteraeota bacterium]
MGSLRNLLDAMRNGRLLAVLFGHMTVDSYVGVLPILYPVLIGRFHVNLATVGLLSLFYTGVASLSQPFFGAVADRIGTRLIGGAMLWSAAWFAVLGFTPTFFTFVLAAGIAGLGSGFFHPLGAVTVRHALPARGRNVAMALYTSGGTVGVALGPLIGATVLALLGIHGTILLLLPGVACSAFLFVWMRGAGRSAPRRARPATPAPAAASGVHRALPLIPLVATVLMMMSRSWTTVTLEAFIPTWYHSLGYQSWFYAPLATTVVLASAVGAVGCGSLADRFGRRAVIIGSLILTMPAVLLFALFPGPQGFVTGALVGLTAASTAPLMLMMAQELLLDRAGLASGLVLGVGFFAGAIGVPITGMVADAIGLRNAMLFQLVIVVLSLPLALLLPTEGYLRRWRKSAATTSTEPAIRRPA